MKILFAANRFPYPPYRGDKLKIYNLARILSTRHELHLITFLEDEQDEKYLDELKKYFKKIILVPHPKVKAYSATIKSLLSTMPLQVGYFQSSKMEQAIDNLLNSEDYDAVHIQHLRLLPYWDKKTSLPRILDLPDAYSLYWRRRVENSSGLKKIFNIIEYKRVLKYEAKLSHFDKTLVCSKEDANHLINTHHLKNVAILPNGVDTRKFFPKKEYTNHNYNILFTGNMDYVPNVDAVQYFVQEIFPIIKQSVPQAQFIIAGQRPVPQVLSLASEDVKVTGFIPDLIEAYHQATVVVAPLRFGAGTQNKVLEAMACGIPVVTRNVGFEGLNIASGNGAILAMDNNSFAKACIKILTDEVYARNMGVMGSDYIKKSFDWEVIASTLESYCYQIKK